MKKKLLLSSSFAILAMTIFCQGYVNDTIKHKINKPSLYGGLGITPLYGSVTVNYETLLVERPNKVFKKRGLRVGTGIYQYYSDGSLNVIISYTSFTGIENNHFELGLGVTYMHFLTTSGRYVAPAPNIGYRYQKPDGKLIFRTGVGFPELLYVSIGYAFK